MGCYLSSPDNRVFVEEGEGRNFTYATASCQGWRKEQEDAEACIPCYDDDASLFILCDGHGGPEVAKYTVKHLPNFIKDSHLYKQGEYEKALEQAFLDFDEHLKSEEAMKELSKIAQEPSDKDWEDDQKSRSLPEANQTDVAGSSSSSAGPSHSDGRASPVKEDDVATLRREAAMPLRSVIKMYTAKWIKDGIPLSPDHNMEPLDKLGKFKIPNLDEEDHTDDSDYEGDADDEKDEEEFGDEKGNKVDDDEEDEDDDDDDEDDDDDDEEDDDDDDDDEEDEEDEEDEDDSYEYAEDDEDGNHADGEKKEWEEDMKFAVHSFMNSTGRIHVPGRDSGCTVVVALLVKGQIFVASVGDSRCMIIFRDGEFAPLAWDHKPTDVQERKRISRAGGRVLEGRVNGGLNLSRAFGDFCYKNRPDLGPRSQMITALPDVLSREVDPRQVEYIFLACDGIWNSMNNNEVVEFIRSTAQTVDNNLVEICVRLFRKCMSPGTDGDGTGCDNMTCIIAKLAEPTLKQDPSNSDLNTEDVKEPEDSKTATSNKRSTTDESDATLPKRKCLRL